MAKAKKGGLTNFGKKAKPFSGKPAGVAKSAKKIVKSAKSKSGTSKRKG